MCVCIVFSRESFATHCDRPSRTMTLVDLVVRYPQFATWIIMLFYDDQSLQPPVVHPPAPGLATRTMVHPMSVLAPACRRMLSWCIAPATDIAFKRLKAKYADIAQQRMRSARLSLVGLHRSQRLAIVGTAVCANLHNSETNDALRRRRLSLGSLIDSNDRQIGACIGINKTCSYCICRFVSPCVLHHVTQCRCEI